MKLAATLLLGVLAGSLIGAGLSEDSTSVLLVGVVLALMAGYVVVML